MRYHSLDSLRAMMMLLGLVLHSAMSYIVQTTPDWQLYDQRRSTFFDVLVLWIHAYRMPVFFVVAGFFANLVWEKHGRLGFVRNRGLRIGLVFAVMLLPMRTVVFAAVHYGLHRLESTPWTCVWDDMSEPGFLSTLPLMHLWFLYYLLLFCSVVLLFKSWVRPELEAAFARVCRWLCRRPWTTALILGIPTSILLMTMPRGELIPGYSIWPVERNAFAVYMLFFGFGFFLYPNRERLAELDKGHGTRLVAGTLMILAAMLWARQGETVPVAVLLGPAGWILVLGFLGFFLHWFNRPNPLIRYVSDSSYWVYLMHFPLVLFGVDALMPLPWPAPLKFLCVLVLSSAILFSSYHFFVRNSWIAVCLNGKRANDGRHAVVERTA